MITTEEFPPRVTERQIEVLAICGGDTVPVSLQHEYFDAFGQVLVEGFTASWEGTERSKLLLDVFATHWSSEGFLSRAHEEARYAAGVAALSRFQTDTQAAAGVPEKIASI